MPKCRCRVAATEIHWRKIAAPAVPAGNMVNSLCTVQRVSREGRRGNLEWRAGRLSFRGSANLWAITYIGVSGPESTENAMNPVRAGRAFKPALIRSVAASALAGGICCATACALPPDRQLSQYGHTAWRMQDGYFSGTINAITQSRDGYIWIGTGAGLVRFDGARFVPFRPSAQDTVRPRVITSLLGASDGSLWIGTTSYLARLKDGHVSGYLDHVGQMQAQRIGRT